MFHTVFSQVRYYFLVLVWNSDVVRQHNIMDLRYIPVSHKSILEAIEIRDSLEATELLRKHIRKGADRQWEVAKMRKMAEES